MVIEIRTSQLFLSTRGHGCLEQRAGEAAHCIQEEQGEGNAQAASEAPEEQRSASSAR